jgi:hypothetical protein
MQVFRTQQQVMGEYNSVTNVVRYANAFGDGLHFEITIGRTGFRKEIVIDALNKLEQPPTSQHKLVAFFKYDGAKTNGTRLRVTDLKDNTEWDDEAYKDGDNGMRIVEEDGLESLVRPAYIYDSSEDSPILPIKVFWKKHDGVLWQAKVLPKQYLLNATYPVRADTVTTTSPDANTETDTVDGGLRGNWNATWSTVRGATTAAGGIDDTSNYLSAAGQTYAPATRAFSGLGYDIYRSYMSFKYNIASGQTVSAVTLTVKNGNADNIPAAGDNDSQAYINVYENTNSSGSKTALATSDYNVANIGTASPLATAVNISGMTGTSTERSVLMPSLSTLASVRFMN